MSQPAGVKLRADSEEIRERVLSAARYVAEVAAGAADEVDTQARFPHETLAALREHRLLAALIPTEFGGLGATLTDVSDAVRTIASNCATSAMLLTMHSIDVSNLARHASTDALRSLLSEIASDQLLCANANSEVGLGGDVAVSKCAIETDAGEAVLVKEALAISFGENADLVFASARRSPESEGFDQVHAICRRPELEPLSEWDAIGLRGTGSRSFRLSARISPDLIYPVPFSEIANSGGTQTTLLLFSSVWVGIAEGAATKAHAYVRAAQRRSIGTLPKSAMRLAELTVRLDQARALLESGLQRWQTASRQGTTDDPALMATLRNLKVASSGGGVEIARMALEICGIAGYRRDTPYSIDRILRDACAGIVMIGNDRLLDKTAETLVIRKRI